MRNCVFFDCLMMEWLLIGLVLIIRVWIMFIVGLKCVEVGLGGLV